MAKGQEHLGVARVDELPWHHRRAVKAKTLKRLLRVIIPYSGQIVAPIDGHRTIDMCVKWCIDLVTTHGEMLPMQEIKSLGVYSKSRFPKLSPFLS